MGVFKKDAHRHWRAQLSEYIDGRVTPEARIVLEAHLAQCDACRQELEALQSTVALLRRVPQAAPPRSFALQAAPARRQGLQAYQGVLRFATAAAAALFVVILAGDLVLNQAGGGSLGSAAERRSAAPQGGAEGPEGAAGAASTDTSLKALDATPPTPAATPSPAPAPAAAFATTSEAEATPTPAIAELSSETDVKARSFRDQAPEPIAGVEEKQGKDKGWPLLRWAEAALAGAFVVLLALTLMGRRRRRPVQR